MEMDRKKVDDDADVIEITFESSSIGPNPNRNCELRNGDVRTTVRVKISGHFRKDFLTQKWEEASPCGDDNHRSSSVEKKTVIPQDNDYAHQDLPEPYSRGDVHTDTPDVEASLPDADAEDEETPQNRSISVQTSPVKILSDRDKDVSGIQEQPRGLSDTTCYDMLINGSDNEFLDLFASAENFSLLDFLNDQNDQFGLDLDCRAVSSQAEGSSQGRMDTLEPEPLVVVQNRVPLRSAQDSALKSALNASTLRKRRRTYEKTMDTSAEKKRCPKRKAASSGRIGDGHRPLDWTMEPDDVINTGICQDEGKEGASSAEKKRCPKRKTASSGRMGDGHRPLDWTVEPDDVINTGICQDEGKEGASSAEKKRCPKRKTASSGCIGDGHQPLDWTMEPDDVINKGICQDEGKEGAYYVEKILATRTLRNVRQFLIQWLHWSEDYNSWEPEGGLDMGADLMIKRKREIELRNERTVKDEVPRFKKNVVVLDVCLLT